MVAESYRSIRTAFLFSQPDAAPRIVLFTSAGPAEGKTMTTLNVAIALAQSGKSVVLIDADLRKGRCHKLLHRPNEKGLSNYLVGSVSLEECLQETSVEGLSLLARGLVPPNPPDLVGSHRMKELLANLNRRFEFVLLDASPVIGVTDAEVLSTFCQAVVFVMHSQKTSRFSARQALQTLEGVRARILGVVLNGIDIRGPDYANYRYYYNSYYAAVTSDEARGGDESVMQKFFDEAPDMNELRSSTQDTAGLTEKKTLDHLILKLSEAVGPMAALIVQDHVALMGESMDAFPNQRLKELLERIRQEIVNDDLRSRFEKNIA
jgi:capsular exopolysaccharide synthesis family protein